MNGRWPGSCVGSKRNIVQCARPLAGIFVLETYPGRFRFLNEELCRFYWLKRNGQALVSMLLLAATLILLLANPCWNIFAGWHVGYLLQGLLVLLYLLAAYWFALCIAFSSIPFLYWLFSDIVPTWYRAGDVFWMTSNASCIPVLSFCWLCAPPCLRFTSL